MIRDEDLKVHREFLGLRNTVPQERFELGDLAIAENVDVNDAKQVVRAKGHSAAVVAGASASIWSTGTCWLAVQGTALIRIQPDYTTAVLRTGLTSGADMSYATLADRTYYSNGVETGVVQNGASRTWGLAVPASQPSAAATGGALPAGKYQYAVTFLRSDGQESGTQRPDVIELTAAGGVRLTGFPTTTDPSVTHLVVYFTTCNGETLYRAGLIDADAASFDYQVEVTAAVPLTRGHLRPAPAGQHLAVFNGHVLVAVGNTLRRSEAYSPELFDLRKGNTFSSAIRMVAPMADGVWVGTDTEVAWLAGAKPDEWQYQQRLTYGVIPGALAFCGRDMVLDGAGAEQVALVGSKQGLCLAQAGGAISNLTQDRFLYPIQERGAAVVRRHRGMVQAVCTMRGTETAAPAAE